MQMAELREDPELKPVFDEIAGKGMDAIDKYWNDMELMSKISKRMEAMRVKAQGDKVSTCTITFPCRSLSPAASRGERFTRCSKGGGCRGVEKVY